jgi:hypothetical protein
MPSSGRPPLYPQAASERIEIRVTPAQRSAVQQAAEEQGVSLSSVIRELIDERVEDRRAFPGRPVRPVQPWDGDDEN